LHQADAESLIAAAIPRSVGVWADLGAGEGTFTRALANLLENGSRIYAVDRDSSVLRWARTHQQPNGVTIVPVVEDFSREFEGVEAKDLLDGILFANSLHFVKDKVTVLKRLLPWLRPGGRVVLVEYDQRAASVWVPHPIPITSLASLARDAGLQDAAVIATRPSRYQGELYCAVMNSKL
jgi:ubiquinone/menaquinone biosynthesis C-methylase UbiE